MTRFGESVADALAAADRWNTPSAFGDRALLDRLGELFDAPEGRTLVTGGVRSFATAWSGRTRTAVVELPSFSEIPEILAAAGPVRRAPWRRLPEIVGELTEPTTVWLTNPARNPDGRSLDERQLDALAALAGAGHQVVLNQVYRWFVEPGPVPEGIWTVTSLAKMCGGGSRLGWAVMPAVEPPEASLRACAPGTVWQRAWAGFLNRRVVADLRSACIEPTVDARRAFETATAGLLGWEFHGDGLSLALECPTPEAASGRHPGARTEGELLALLAEAGVSASPGAAFAMPTASVRLAFSGVAVAQARDAAERIARLVDRAGPCLRPCPDGL
ncbi:MULTISPECIES: aminotransferase class I/II-fold pyridoxal phosphate-dependent enzyme [unclassified Kitasatospora]|uniref:aminotransferase class I/II-fold pyridoxal phosphate-dependent enzyme n=1 Tax=unclassified Kitasatospora TaxID=2633591 RepID=UPI00340849AF